MSLTKITFGAALVVALCACAPAAQQSTAQTDTAEVQTDTVEKQSVKLIKTDKKKNTHLHRETVKPGADVSINTVLPKIMTPGSYQTVQLEFSDGYADGVLSVEVVPSEGLSLFGGAKSKTFNMATPGPHKWDLDVKADVDGVYFLNVFASAKDQPRSFSVRLDMGVVSQKMFDDAMPADGELAAGGKIRVLKADEDIR